MRKYAFRKMTRDDFNTRVKRLDPQYFQHGDTKPVATCRATAHPYLCLLLGFGWAYLIFAIAGKRSLIETSLMRGSIPVQYHDYIFYALAALLAVSAVMLAIHVLRYVCLRRGRPGRSNSGGLLVGAAAAAALAYMPSSVLEAGFGLLDDNSKTFIMATSQGVREAMPAELTSVAFIVTD
ncbi:hypothetical protein [Salipiger abyssi]|uniref:Uncharacterized protein n=1 Tax=Salipiger abyssi TaxID=1250539 RepID=A0A1P8V035_9RHOB|nr:hypothetical protein [Salipiger abyssi]APZ54956.1 hypothetical protein Ga0080574_TMP4622 [Salipiger abyssi]